MAHDWIFCNICVPLCKNIMYSQGDMNVPLEISTCFLLITMQYFQPNLSLLSEHLTQYSGSKILQLENKYLMQYE